MDITHRTVACGDVDLHVALAATEDGDPVVLLHGWPQTWRSWRYVAAMLGRYRLVMPDLRGLGESSIPGDGVDAYAKRTLAGDVVALVDALGLDRGRVVVVGHDWGGVVAVHAASLLGARGLAVLDVTVPNDLGAGVDIAQGGARWHHAFHRTTLAEELVVGKEDAYYGWFYATLGARPDAIAAEDAAAYVDAYRGPERTRAGFSLYRALAQDVADAQLIGHHGLTMPVLALGGEESWGRGWEPAACLEFFASDVTGGTIAGAGHFLPEEAPSEVASRLRAFLEGLPR